MAKYDIQSSFLVPKNVQVTPKGNNRFSLALEPFERGFGYTLGNAMRRILLSLLFLAAGPAWASGPCGTTDVIAELSAEDKARLVARAEAEPYGEGTLFRAEKEGSVVTVVGTTRTADLDVTPPALYRAIATLEARGLLTRPKRGRVVLTTGRV